MPDTASLLLDIGHAGPGEERLLTSDASAPPHDEDGHSSQASDMLRNQPREESREHYRPNRGER